MSQMLPTPYKPPPTDDELKMEKVKSLVAAMDRILVKREWTYQDAVYIQQLRQQRQELLGLLPKIRLVVDNT